MIGWIAAVLIAIIIAVASVASHWHKRNHEYRMKQLEQDHDLLTGDELSPEEVAEALEMYMEKHSE